MWNVWNTVKWFCFKLRILGDKKNILLCNSGLKQCLFWKVLLSSFILKHLLSIFLSLLLSSNYWRRFPYKNIVFFISFLILVIRLFVCILPWHFGAWSIVFITELVVFLCQHIWMGNFGMFFGISQHKYFILRPFWKEKIMWRIRDQKLNIWV